MPQTSAITTRARRFLRSVRRQSAKPWVTASRFYRGSSYVFNLIVWSRIAAGRTRHGSIELPPEILLKKGVTALPPHLTVSPAAQGEPFAAGFAEVYALLFANLQKPGILSRHYHARPGPAFHGVYLWDSAFIAQVWKCWSSEIAAEVILSVVHLRAEDRLQHVVSEFTQSQYTQPPLIAWSAVETARWMSPEARRAFFQTIYEPLARYHDWLCDHRQLANGLFFWEHPYESGVENAPRFGSRDERVYRDTRRLAAPDLCSYIILQLEALEAMATALDRPTDARRHAQDAAVLQAAVEKYLWHEEDGLYFDRDVQTGDFVRCRSIASLMPLWAGVPSSGRAERLRATIVDPEDFGTLLPLPSVSRRDPDFEKDMWRGPVWINTAYGILQGLLRYGFDEDAGALAYRLCEGVYRVFETERRVYEFYDPEAFHTRDLCRKRGNRWKALTLGSGPQTDFVGWSGLVNTLLVEVLLGLTIDGDSVALHPRFPPEAQGQTFTLNLPAQNLSFALTRAGDGSTQGTFQNGSARQKFRIDAGGSRCFPSALKHQSCDTAI